MPVRPLGLTDRIALSFFQFIRRRQSGARFRSIFTNDNRLWPVYHRRPPKSERSDGVPIVFFHGFGNDGTTWLPFFEVLGTRREVVAPDLPGFGDHPLTPQEEPTPQWYCGVAAELLRELTVRWGQPPIVVGKSMGGMIAGLVAGELPDLVRALVLIDPGGIQAPRISAFWEAWKNGTNYLLPEDDADWRRMIDILYYQPVEIPGFARRAALHKMRSHHQRYARMFNALLAEGFNPLGERLLRITCPVTVIWGAQDAVMDPSGVEVIKEALPHARIELLEKCGHSPTRERPDEVKRILLNVLNRWG